MPIINGGAADVKHGDYCFSISQCIVSTADDKHAASAPAPSSISANALSVLPMINMLHQHLHQHQQSAPGLQPIQCSGSGLALVTAGVADVKNVDPALQSQLNSKLEGICFDVLNVKRLSHIHLVGQREKILLV